MSLVVGVDGGGTRTRVVILDAEGGELARTEGPPALVGGGAADRAAAVIEETVRLAADRAGVDLPCAALWVGLAGAGREETRAAVEGELHRHGLADRIAVGTDVEAAAEDAFAGGSGILLVAGTGSIAWGRTEAGATHRVGGWGPIVGDEGSGWSIGLAAVRRALHALDRRAPDTQLVPTLLERVGVDDPRALVAWVSGATRAEVAALVPLVVAVAEEGDAAARDILAEAARALADHVRALRPGAAWSAPVPFAMAGGLLDPGGPLGDAVLAELADLDLDPVGRALRPAVGAAHLARRMTEPEAGA